jgi:hypothetical protein
LLAAAFEIDIDGIARGTRLVENDDAFLAQDGVTSVDLPTLGRLTMAISAVFPRWTLFRLRRNSSAISTTSVTLSPCAEEIGNGRPAAEEVAATLARCMLAWLTATGSVCRSCAVARR